eukprot:TRINITY_DN2952_c0_g1_i2.p2 TRINITY_DN2952_c0_g1~~TRINITY_DN2952_c0_g1_i2.p2  ORF type:complete len:759 (-),score=86.00 TRINITY_DN2952_c0_g1_i2:44-2320(-)
MVARRETAFNAYESFFGWNPHDACCALSMVPSLDIENGRKVRDLVLTWSQRYPINMNLRDIAIFETFGGNFVKYSDPKVFTSPSDEWDELIGPLFPNFLLPFNSTEKKAIFELSRFNRMPNLEFIDVIMVSLLSKTNKEGHLKEVKSEVCLEVLRTMARSSNMRKDAGYARLKQTPLVVLDDGSRVLCSEFLDPEDRTICSILDASSHLFPPISYRDPAVLRSMRALGMLGINNFSVFLKIAKEIEHLGLTEGGMILLKELSKEAVSASWTRHDILTLSTVKFVPCYEFLSLNYPPLPFVEFPTYKAWNIPTKKKSALAKEPKQNRRNRNRNTKKEDLSDEEGAQEGFDPHIHFLAVCTALKEHFAERKVKTPSQSSQQSYVRLESFSSVSLALNSTAWYTWKEAFILPSALDAAPISLLSALGVHYPVSPMVVAKHLKKMIHGWHSTDLLKQEPIHVRQQIIRLCFAAISDGLRNQSSNKQLYKFTPSFIADIPAVLLDNGDYVTCNKVVIDLESDISTNLLAMPEYLSDFGQLMRSVGSPALNHQKYQPLIKSAPPVFTGFFDAHVSALYNNPMFSDVHFQVTTQQGSLHTLYAHKLVISASSPVFSSMFTSSFKESNPGASSGLVVLTEHPIVCVNACQIMLKYLYTGEIDYSIVELYPHTSESVMTVFGLLSLADKYILKHLKEWCEVYLSHEDVVNIHNIIDLFQMAHDFNAPQLKRMCVSQMQDIVSVVREMEEWDALSEDLKTELLSLLTH